MQQKNNSNFILFFVLSSLVLAGWMLVQTWLNPPRPRPVNLVPLAAGPWAQLTAWASTPLHVPALLGPGGALQLSTQVPIANWLSEQGYRLPAPVAALNEPKPVEKPKPVVTGPPVKHEEPQLGNEDSNLLVRLTSRGAAVLSVTLNQFKAADKDARPVLPPERLELVPEELNRFDPSNKLLLYANPDDDHPQETLGTIEWRMESYRTNEKPDRRDEVVFVAELPAENLRIRKTFTLRPEDYHVGLKVEFQGLDAGKQPGKVRYLITSGHGLPIEGVWFTNVFRNALVGSLGQRDNFWRAFQDSRTIAQKGGERVLRGESVRIQYGAIAVQYFASVVAVTEKVFADDPNEQATKQDFVDWARPRVVGALDKEQPQLTDIGLEMVSVPFELKEQAPVVNKYLLYYGPVKVRLLGSLTGEGRAVPQEVVARYIDQLHLNTLTDYSSPNWLGEHVFGPTGWSRLLIFFTNFMLDAISTIHRWVPNWGLCIIILTLLVRGLMHPISRKQAKSSLKMQALVPEIKALQEKHKGDRQALGVAQMELYRKHGVSPIGSCWVVFLQMPIFLGLYYALQESIFFRLAPFLWIKNLAAPDMLFFWGRNVPLISTYLGPFFNLLPIFAVALMIVQQKLLTPPPTDEQSEMQQKMMKYMMIFFGFMFYKVAAGLCVYFIVSSGWGLAERKLLPKVKPAAPTGGTASASGGSFRDRPGRPPGPRGARPKGPKADSSNGSFKKLKDMWQEILKQAQKK
jgi:YidC/Oxa1 family membrane protein insertase